MHRRSARTALLPALTACALAAGLAACGGTADVADTGAGATQEDAGQPRPDATAGASDAGNTEVDAGPIAELREIRIAIVGPTTLPPSRTATLTATGILTTGGTIDLARAATWHTSSATTARVLAGGTLATAGVGRAEVWATRGTIESNRLDITVATSTPPAPEGELRGVWVTRWTFASAADIQRIVDDVDRAHLNAIFFQTRGTADAYYSSPIEPWASRLSGTLGRDPGWDPLAEVIRRAHEKNIQVHAWLNTFPAWSGTTAATESTPRHATLVHPEWLCADMQGRPMPLGAEPYQFFSPGNPDVRAYVASVAEDIATRYEVDGIHFDFIRYPGPTYCYDAASETGFRNAVMAQPGLARGDWQRDQITTFVGDMKQRLSRVRPRAALTVANWGIFTNEWGWSSVSRGYNDYFQDAHRWAREGLVDALCPMTYWRLTQPRGQRTDFATLTDHHVSAGRAGGRHVYEGISAEFDGDEILAEVAYARQAGARGVVFFDLSQLRTNGHLDRLLAGPFAERASPPPMPWK